MTEAILSFHEHQIARNLRARDAHPGALFDVYYDRLVADPIGTVRDIYDHYGLAWSEEFAERLNHYLRQNPRGKHGAHLYAPENFGQTKDTISEASPLTSRDSSLTAQMVPTRTRANGRARLNLFARLGPPPPLPMADPSVLGRGVGDGGTFRAEARRPAKGWGIRGFG